MSTQAKLLKDVPVIDIGADTPVLALDSSGAVGKGTLAAQLDLYFTLGITGRVFHQARSYEISYNDVLGWLDKKQNQWSGIFPEGLQYVIWEIHTIDGVALLYEKVKSYADPKIFTSPILAKIPGKPWRWSKNVTESNSGGVISCTAIGPYLVAYKEKGGPHEHCGKNSDFGLHQTIGAGHNNELGIYHRLQHLYDGWSIFVHNQGRSWTATKCEPLWDTAGGDILPIRGAVIPQSRWEDIHKVIHYDKSDRPRVCNLDYTVDLTPRKEVVAA